MLLSWNEVRVQNGQYYLLFQASQLFILDWVSTLSSAEKYWNYCNVTLHFTDQYSAAAL